MGWPLLALGDEDIHVDGVAVFEFGNHRDQSINAPLRQTRLPFLGIDHIVHVFSFHVDPQR